MYDVNEKFENLVLFMAENYNSYDTELNDAITTFEEAIETSGNGEAAFGIARDDWERIEITEPPYKCNNAQFYAEYNDGFQAPFLFGGAEEWYRKEFGRSTEAGLKAEKQNVADALLSFMYGSFEDRRRYEAALNAITDEEKKKVFMEEWQDGRTSMKNIGEYAHQLGEKLK